MRLLSASSALVGLLLVLIVGCDRCSMRQRPTLALDATVLRSNQYAKELRDFAEAFTPPQPEAAATSREEWTAQSAALRRRLVDEIFYEPPIRDLTAKTTAVQVGVIERHGVKIRKLRLEVLNGLWVPAYVYEPLSDRAPADAQRPVIISFIGHASGGEVTAPVHQIRAMHLARQGCVVVTAEWFGNGELAGSENDHANANLIDLAGVHGVGVHFAFIERVIDLALAQPGVDPSRVAAIGLSGGGWLSLIAGALDERISLVNSVSGFGSYAERAPRIADLGDSEQSPPGLYAIADYTTIASLIAPRRLLLTYNQPDSCCYRASLHRPPLEANLVPLWTLFDAGDSLRFYTGTDPGTHNFEADNRRALYRFLVDSNFVPASFSMDEGDVAKLTPTKDELTVGLEGNTTLKDLASQVTANVRRRPLPRTRAELAHFQERLRNELRELLNATRRPEPAKLLSPQKAQSSTSPATLLFRVADRWSVPAVSYEPAGAKTKTGTTVIVADDRRSDECAGAAAAAATIAGERAIAIDLLHTGDAQLHYGDALYSMFFEATNRPSLGVQVDQLRSVVAALRGGDAAGVHLVGCSPRTSTIALVAAGLDERDDIATLSLNNPPLTLGNTGQIYKRPEMYPFGLLQHADINELYALAMPRPITLFHNVPTLTPNVVDLANAIGAQLDERRRP